MEIAKNELDKTLQGITQTHEEKVGLAIAQILEKKPDADALLVKFEATLTQAQSAKLPDKKQEFSKKQKEKKKTKKTGPKREGPFYEKLWPNGSTLRVKFLEAGFESEKELVKSAARTWEQYANLHFEFNDDSDAEIRIGFKSDEGYWSYTGIAAPAVDKAQSTMSLSPDWLGKEIKLTFLGHAIGLIAENNMPKAHIPWNKEAVYQAHPFWDRMRVEFKYFRKNSFEIDKSFDPQSIMLPTIPNKWTIGDFEFGPNTELSEGDKKWVAYLYPKD